MSPNYYNQVFFWLNTQAKKLKCNFLITDNFLLNKLSHCSLLTSIKLDKEQPYNYLHYKYTLLYIALI